MSTQKSNDQTRVEAIAPPVSSAVKKSPPEIVRSIKGKYAKVPGTSDEYLAEKHRDERLPLQSR